jgi:hypothetical protein
MRDARCALRIRHDALAVMLGRKAPALADDVLRLRHAIEDAGARVVERFESDDGASVIGLYLTLPQSARFAELTGSSGDAVLESFGRWREFEAELALEDEADRRHCAAAGAAGFGPGTLGGLRAELAGLRADFVAAGLLPHRDPPDGDPSGDAPGKGGVFGLRRLLPRWRRHLKPA